MDVAAMYLSDPGVWQRIGFPGPSTASGGYPDFDQPQDTHAVKRAEARAPERGVHAASASESPAASHPPSIIASPSMNTPSVLPAVQTFLAKPARMLIGNHWR